MLARQRMRKLIYVPQLSGGRKTFLHFYWDGYAWSLRDFSDPHLPHRPRYRADLHLTVEEILALARAPGVFCLDAPTQSPMSASGTNGRSKRIASTWALSRTHLRPLP